jgi:hypothetical protein
MSLLNAIVPPDTAFVEGRRLPHITVRPKGIEPPPGPGHASLSPADASDWTDNAPPARTDLFDDIVPPAGPEHARPLPADASDETENAASARTGRLFDDIVPPADTPASDLPEPEGGQFAAPLPDGRNFRVAREGISPPAGFADRLAKMWENPPTDRSSLIGSIKSAYKGARLPGDVYSGETPITGPDGHTNPEVIDRAQDLAQVVPLRAAPGGIFARPPVGSRQILAETSEQGVPIPRAGPQPPAKPPDTAVAQSDRMIQKARESGPSALEGREQDTLRSGPRPPARPPDKAAAQSDRMTSGARESGLFDSKARPAGAPPDFIDAARSPTTEAWGGAYVLRGTDGAVIRSGRTG